MSENGLQFDLVLDRIIEITEKNLTMQHEFLSAVHELKTRFDSLDRDNSSFKEHSDAILNNTIEIINKMRFSPNEKIIEILDELKTKLIIIENIGKDIETCREHDEECIEHRLSVADLAKDVKDIAESYRFVKKVLGAIALLVLGFQIIFGMYQTHKNNDLVKVLSDEIRIELKK